MLGFLGMTLKSPGQIKPYRTRVTDLLHTEALNLGYCVTPEEATRVYDLYILFNYGPKATTNQSLGLLN